MVDRPFYEQIDHTADLGIHVYGHSATGLFQNAAMALMDVMVETALVAARQEMQTTIEGRDWPDLMVNWLREILYLWSGKAVLVHSVQIASITENRLSARIWVDPFSKKHHTLTAEIKAVTYHQARVWDVDDQWEATIIFDT